MTKHFVFRTQYHHLFQNIIGKNTGRLFGLLERIERYSLKLQKHLRIHRPEIVPLYKGTQWFSITDDPAQYLLKQEKIIKKQFYYSMCGDEVFLHSIAMASPYRENIVNNSLRAIDWKRGDPYIYRKEDICELLSSPCLFARKFDSRIDQGAIDEVIAHLSNNSLSF